MSTLHWYITKDGDRDCLKMYERHYSAYKFADGRKRYQFTGPGQTIILRTLSADAIFVWRKFFDKCIDERTGKEQSGINCSIFRNEGPIRSSQLIRQADAIADFCWPGERHYTYVNAAAVRNAIPGYCFRRAGWRRCGLTKGGHLVLERITSTTAGDSGKTADISLGRNRALASTGTNTDARGQRHKYLYEI